ncbi:MAG: radical SAM protein [Chloroflexi bacterium]|nr:radical SAM protein [Chloroflexota bacterium]
MKVYVLNPPYVPHFGRGMRWQDTGRAGTLYYPIWLSYAAGIQEAEGHQVRLVDAPAWNWDREMVVKDVAVFSPSLLVMDSSFPSLRNDIAVGEAIKEVCPEAKIVMVGPPASQFDREILQSPGVDFVARWEYDLTLVELARNLDSPGSWGQMKGISYKDERGIIRNPDRPWSTTADLDKMPFVSQVYARHLNIKDYFLGNSLYPEVQIFTGRGCPYQCSFCSWPQTLMGRKYRVRTIPNVMDELEWVEGNLPLVKEVFLEDDTFTIDPKRVIQFTQEYARRGLRIPWSCNARASLDMETMERMKEANCRLLIVGYESGNDEILRNIKKAITVDQMRQFAHGARRAGLLVLGDFIIGLPGETRETMKATRELIRELKPDMLQVSVASPFPGTEFFQWAQTSGYLVTDDPNEYLDDMGHQKSIVSYPWLSGKEIVGAVDEILKGYYFSFRFVPVAWRQICRRHGWDEAKRLWRLAKTFTKYVVSRPRRAENGSPSLGRKVSVP